MAKKKSGSFNKEGIESLAKDKPVVYKILNSKDKNIYTGHSKKGNVEQRIKDHLPGGQDPVRGGKKVVINQKSSVAEAKKSEGRIIKKDQPSQNIKGK